MVLARGESRATRTLNARSQSGGSTSEALFFMLTVQNSNSLRTYRDEAGKDYVSVTSAIRHIGEVLGEEEFPGVPKALLRMHALEGEGCHAACLGWLAVQAGLYPSFALPPKPDLHPDQARWKNVVANALMGFQKWCDVAEPEVLAIEQPAAAPKYGFAGQPDLKAIVRVRESRAKAIVELKFTAALTAAHEVQLCAYHLLDGFCDCRIGLLLRIDRTTGAVNEKFIHWQNHLHHQAAFLNSVGLLRWAQSIGR